MGKFFQRKIQETNMDGDKPVADNRKQYVQTFGKKKQATAVAICRSGKGTIRVNGVPIDLVEPALLRQKVLEPVLLLGMDRFSKYDIRAALARAIVAYYQKHLEEYTKREIKEIFLE